MFTGSCSVLGMPESPEDDYSQETLPPPLIPVCPSPLLSPDPRAVPLTEHCTTTQQCLLMGFCSSSHQAWSGGEPSGDFRVPARPGRGFDVHLMQRGRRRQCIPIVALKAGLAGLSHAELQSLLPHLVTLPPQPVSSSLERV